MIDLGKAFDYENGFYLAAAPERFSKLVTHLDLFRMTSGVRGEIVECGVFKGASLCRWTKFRALLENTMARKVIGFDIFGEFPEAGFAADREKRDSFVREAGSSSIGRQALWDLLAAQGLERNVELVEGDICQTVPAYCAANDGLRISLLNVDVDLYEPTKVALETLVPRVVPGGIIILDDYGVFPGASKAVDEYFAGTGTRLEKLPFSHAITFIRKG